MQTAADLMVAPVIVSPRTSVRELAEVLQQNNADGACVTEQGRLVGVATTMDLIYRETSIHLPTTVVLLDAVITLPGARARAQRELERIAASTVRDMMSSNPVTVRPGAMIQHCANLMVHKHLSLLPVVDEQHVLLGVVTKDAMVRALGLLQSG